ncbi:MAG: GNAT family N-acetyltransferase [Dehalococcoidia bacterium]|nr:GNAT family N-acetyltransferase [Dehalococcoidia bacterium]
MSDLTRRAVATDYGWMALGNERSAADGATFIRNPSVPRIRDANQVVAVNASAPDEIEVLMARADREYAGCPHRQFRIDFAAPPEFEARLALEGYERKDTLVMLLEGETAGAPNPCDIRPVESEADWQAYSSLHEIDWREYADKIPGGADMAVAEQMVRTRRAKTPPVRYWLAWADGQPRAYLASWEGVDGVGQVEDLFTHPEFRHRGLATALIHHCVADCRAHGAGAVVIAADTADTPKNMYAALGFRPVAISRTYWRDLRR